MIMSMLFWLILIPFSVLLIYTLIFLFCEKRGIPIRRIICRILEVLPFALVFLNDILDGILEPCMTLVFVGIAVFTIWTMIYWKHESYAIEGLCALVLIFVGFGGMYQALNYGASSSDIFKSFCFLICGIGCARYMVKCNPNK